MGASNIQQLKRTSSSVVERQVQEKTETNEERGTLKQGINWGKQQERYIFVVHATANSATVTARSRFTRAGVCDLAANTFFSLIKYTIEERIKTS